MNAPWNSRTIVVKFLQLIFLQLLSSTFLFIPVLVAIKYLGNTDTEYVAYFSFATNLTIGFTKMVLIVSHSLESKKNDSQKLQLITTSEVKYLVLIVGVQCIFAIIVLKPDIAMLILLHIGIFSMAIIEHSCQCLFIKLKWKMALRNYSVLVVFFSALFLIYASSQEINEESLLACWSVSTILVALFVTFKSRNSSKITKVPSPEVHQNRSYLALDFVINYGLMQLIYSLGTLFTSSQEMLKYRILMFFSIPTNVLIQVLSTTGLPFIFANQKNRKFKILAFDAIAIIPIAITIMAFQLIGSTRFSALLGEMWIQVPNSFLLFVLMSLTSVVLAHTTMVIRWHKLTKSLFQRRLLFSLVQIPISIFAIYWYGANGILASLSLFNMCFLSINVWKIVRSKISLA